MTFGTAATHRHGDTVQLLPDARREPLWVSGTGPGPTVDITAARRHVFPLVHKATADGVVVLAPPGYEGAGAAACASRSNVRPRSTNMRWHVNDRAYNRLLRGLRCVGERAMAVLTGRWRVLRHTTRSPSKIGTIAHAAPTLTKIEKKLIEITSWIYSHGRSQGALAALRWDAPGSMNSSSGKGSS
ncbi:transposase family protein [Nocardiopsis algeriensis]|uniref:transposase family protein n=1 Tax=Nocardiopsis algeriensis TaxID=1478215 RepID=UPI003B43AE38